MPKLPVGPGLDPKSKDEIESSYEISQDQLTNAKIFTNREGYIKTLPSNIKFLELGVAWGYSAKLVCEATSPAQVDLLDWFNQDLRCWSWRKFGSCQCGGFKHEMLYTPETHEEYIKKEFYKYNAKTIKADAREGLKQIQDKYDYIYIDVTNERETIREILSHMNRLTTAGSIVGLNDYLIYDGVIEDKAYGTFQSVNEFLLVNKNWSVDALALHPLGFYDIYLKRTY